MDALSRLWKDASTIKVLLNPRSSEKEVIDAVSLVVESLRSVVTQFNREGYHKLLKRAAAKGTIIGYAPEEHMKQFLLS